MMAQQVEWALQPFIQGGRFFTGEVPGTGFGLPTVATLAWQLGDDPHILNRHAAASITVALTLPRFVDGDDDEGG